MRGDDGDIQSRKDVLRAALMAARRDRSAGERLLAQRTNSDHLGRVLAGRRCVAAYLPLPSEPLDAALLDILAAVCTVLVPVTVGPAPLDWCRYPAPVRPGALGIAEPVGERLGAGAIAVADAVLVPALAVGRDGHRLGRGGGHYDRTLALLDQIGAPGSGGGPDLIAVVYDEELLDGVPFDALDHVVSAVVTPSSGLLRLA